VATDARRPRAVFDTNIIVAALLSRNLRSPLVELLTRWRRREFALVYCEDLHAEYREKLIAKRVEIQKMRQFMNELLLMGAPVTLSAGDVRPRVPADPDDDIVVACAIVGRATHLVTYDPHIHTLGPIYQGIRIIDGLHFLYALRGDLPPPTDATKR
jgi:putative PIN family toxin of toxin-antitoxin system